MRRAEEVHRASRPPLRVVRRKQRGLIKRTGSRRAAPALIVLSILVVATVGGVLLEQVILAKSAFEMAQIREDMAAAEDEHSQLLLDAARLGSSDRIERYAIERLGMVRPLPARVQYIVADVPSNWSRSVARRGSPTRPGGSAGEVFGVRSPRGD